MKGKKLLALVLTVALTAGLVACSDKEETQNEGANTITVFGGVVDRVSEPSTEEEKADEAWYKLVEEKNNIKIVTDVPASANLSERLQIMLSSGEYPDAILFQDHTDVMFKTAVENGIVIPITEYVKNAPLLQENIHENAWKCMEVMNDGEIYGIPRSTCVRADGYVVRKDWLEKVGLSIPEDGAVTIDEFTEILKRFTENDPDGNGRADTYGLAHSLNAASEYMPAVMWPFDILGWQEHEGKYEYMDAQYCLEHDKYLKCLEYNKMLYQNKYIDPDAPVLKSYAERFNQGITGVMPAFAANVNSLRTNLRRTQPDAELAFITGIKNENGEVKGTLYSTGYFWFFAVTSAAKDPEKVVQMFNSMFEDDVYDGAIYGFEGINFKTNENGEKERIFDKDGKAITTTAGRQFMRKAFDTEFFLGKKIDDNDTPDMETRDNWLKQTMENHVTSHDLGHKPEVAINQEYIDYQKKMTQVTAKILVGEMETSEYTAALEKWYETHGTEYVEEMNKYIKSMK